MKLVAQTSPYIRKNVSVKRMMLDVVIALMPVTLFAMIYNGWNGIYVFLISVATFIGLELFCHAIMHWPKELKLKQVFTKDGFAQLKSIYTINNILAPLISGLIFALIMPAGANWYVVFTSAIFGIVIGKMVFGGLGSNIFNPAGVARVFAAICFSVNYDTSIAIVNSRVDATLTATPLAQVNSGMLGNIGDVNWWNMLWGNVPGCMGEVSVILILVGAVYLFIRHSADIRAFLGYVLSFGFVMLIGAIAYLRKDASANVFAVWGYQMLAGGMLFGATFMITDPVTSPTSKYGRVLFGAIAGCITALIRVAGAMPEGVVFSILIANMLAPCIDYFMRGKPNKYTWLQWLILGTLIIVVSGIVAVLVMGVTF